MPTPAAPTDEGGRTPVSHQPTARSDMRTAHAARRSASMDRAHATVATSWSMVRWVPVVHGGVAAARIRRRCASTRTGELPRARPRSRHVIGERC